MGVDWEFLRTVINKPEDWNEDEFEEVYQNISSVTKLKQRDRTLEKLQLLFGLSQAVMIAKWNQVKFLEGELERTAESAGRLDAQRERELLEEIDNLTHLLAAKERGEDTNGELPYDWATGLRKQKQELETKLINKNHEIDQLIVDINNKTSVKEKLEREVFDLQLELKKSTATINSLTSELAELKEKFDSSQGALREGEEKLLSLRAKYSEMRSVKVDLENKYKDLTLQVDQRVEKVSEVLVRKEKEIEKLKKDLKNRISLRAVQSTKHHTENSEDDKKILELKDEEISLLRQKLSEATKEINEKTEHLLHTNHKRSIETESSKEVTKLRRELHESQQHIKRLERQLTAAEDDAQIHAQDLATVLSELKTYMCGEFSLADAVAELKKVRRELVFRDTQIMELTAEMNGLQINANALYRENEELREQLSLEPERRNKHGKGKQQDWKDSKKMIENLTTEVLNLQEEKTSLRAKVFELTRTISSLKTDLETPKRLSLEGLRDDTDQLGSMKDQLGQLVAMVSELANQRRGKRSYEENHDAAKCEAGPATLRDENVDSLKDQLEKMKENYEKLKMENFSLEKIIKNLKNTTPPESLENTMDSNHQQEDQMYHKNLKKYHKLLKRLPLSSQETLTRLKSQVQFLVEEVSVKTTEIQKGESDLANYRTQFESLHEEVSTLNDQLMDEREKWTNEAEALREAKAQLEAKSGALEAQVEELKRFLGTGSTHIKEDTKMLSLQCAESKYEAELNGRMLKFLMKELELLRERLKGVKETHLESSKKIKQLENQLVQEREYYHLRRKRDQQRIDNSVSWSVHASTASELAAITTKYRGLLNEKVLQKKETLEICQLKSEIMSLRRENDSLIDQCCEDKKNLRTLQNSFSSLMEQQLDEESKVYLLSKQVAAAEVREQTAKQKANHALRVLQTCQDEKGELLAHLQEVEEVNKKVLEENVALQEKEIILQTQITAQFPILRQELQLELETLKAERDKLVLEARKLEGLFQIADGELEHYKSRCKSAEIETEEERRRQRDFASLRDEKLQIASMHLELSHEKVINEELRVALEEAVSKQSRTSLELDKTLFKMNNDEQSIIKLRDFHQQRSVQLLLIIKDLRVQFAGAVPLPQQERLVSLVDELTSDKRQLEDNLNRAKRDRQEATLMLQEMKAKMESIEDIHGAQKTTSMPNRVVSQWSKKLESVRLANVRLKDKICLLEEEQSMLQASLKVKEDRCSYLHEELSRLEKLWVEQQKVWEDQQLALDNDGGEHVNITERKNDVNKTQNENELRSQLVAALTENENIKHQLRTTQIELDKTNARSQLVARHTENENNKHQLQTTHIELDKTNTRSQLDARPTDNENIKDQPQTTQTELDKNHHKASKEPCFQIIIKGLKERVQIAEDALEENRSLLKKSQTEMRERCIQYEREIDHLKDDKIQLKSRVKELQSEINDIPVKYSKSQNTLARSLEIQTLQETVSSLEANLEKSNEERLLMESMVNRMEMAVAASKRERNEEKQEIEMACEIRVQQMQREIGRLNKHISSLQEERDIVKKELTTIQENVIKSPSLILKALVEKLRDRLIEKEKQISDLSRNVEELREKVMVGDDGPVLMDSIVNEKPVRDSDPPSPVDQFEYKDLKMKIRDLEEANTKLEIRLKDLTSFTTTKEETHDWKKKYDATYNHKLKLEKDLKISKRKSEDLHRQILEFEKKEKNVTEEMIKEKQERQEKIYKSVLEWECKKKLEGKIKVLQDKLSESEKSLRVSETKLSISRSLLDKSEKEKLGLREKITKLNKSLAENMCSVCFKSSNVVKDLNRTYTIETKEENPHETVTKVTQEGQNQTENLESKSCANCEFMAKEKIRLDKKLKDTNQKLTNIKNEKVLLETKLSESFKEINALRTHNERLNEHLKQANQQKTSRPIRPSSAAISKASSEFADSAQDKTKGFLPGMSGANLVLSYENQIESLQEEIREKVRIQLHVKKVLEEALAKEEELCKDRDRLLQKITILETVKEDTPDSKLVVELRKAKVTIHRLQREIEARSRQPKSSNNEED